jgi:hypothetical protein
MPSEPVSAEHHLSQPKSRSESGEVAHRNDADKIEEQADEAGVGETEEEEPLREESNSERRNYHIGRQPLSLLLGRILPNAFIDSTYHRPHIQ